MNIIDLDSIIVAPKATIGLRVNLLRAVAVVVLVIAVCTIILAMAAANIPKMIVAPVLIVIIFLCMYISEKLYPWLWSGPTIVNSSSDDPLAMMLKSVTPAEEYFKQAQDVDENIASSTKDDVARIKALLDRTAHIKLAPRSEDATPPERAPANDIAVGVLSLIFFVYCAVAIPFIIYNAMLYFNAIAPLHNSTSMIQWMLAPPLNEPHFKGGNISRFTSAWVAVILSPLVGLPLIINRLAMKTPHHLLEFDPRPFSILLRSFHDDNLPVCLVLKDGIASIRFEEALGRLMTKMGPFIALGSPRERLPRVGAARAYIDGEAWRTRAKQWMANSRLILVVVGDGDGLAWEYSEIRARGYLNRTIFLFHPRPPVEVFHGNRLLARWKAERQWRWKEFSAKFPEISGPLNWPAVDATKIVAIWRANNDAITIVTATEVVAQEYEVAIRLALADFHVFN